MTQITQNLGVPAAPATVSPKAWPRTGWVVSGFAGLFFLADGVLRVAGFAPYVEGTVRYGYAAETAPWLGATLVIATLLYLLPRTAVLGALLITAYLGGAVSAHVQAGEPVAFAVAFGVITWAGLWLRYPELRRIGM